MAPIPAKPARRTSRDILTALAVVVPTALVCGAAGAFGAHAALGPAKAPKTASKPHKPVTPAGFQALPDACQLVPKAIVATLVPAAKMTPNTANINNGGGVTATPDPAGSCEWEAPVAGGSTITTLDVALDLHPSDAVATGNDHAKQFFTTSSTTDQKKSERSIKEGLETNVYGKYTGLSGLGENAYSIYKSYTDTLGGNGGTALWILRGNVIIEVTYTGFVSVPSDNGGLNAIKPLPEQRSDPGASQVAAAVVAALNSCQGCAAH